MKKKSRKKSSVKDWILNGKARKRMSQIQELVNNIEISRAAMARATTGKGEEDVDEECGYPDDTTFEMYKRMYQREGIAKRVVSILPSECWSAMPWVYETEKIEKKAETKGEKAWLDLQDQFNIIGKLRRLDECSRIGQYGIMLIGINDKRSLDRPVDGINEDGEERFVRNPKPRKLTYLMPFDQGQADIESFQEDMNSKRYGKPLYYKVRFADPSQPFKMKGKVQSVHWSRVIHVADNPIPGSDVFGIPAQEPCYNYLLNIRKTLGGSAEMFWKGGFPGLVAQTVPGLEVDFNKASVEKEFEKYFNKLSRALAVENMEIKTLQSNIEDPETHINAQIMAICIAIETPQRMFMGTEEARMASIQDSESWNKKVHARMNMHCTPNILRPFVERLMMMRVLPKFKKVYIQWPDIYSISESDRADITGKLVEAISEYVTSGASRLFPPLQFLTLIMDLTRDEAEEVIKAAEKEVKKQSRGTSIAVPIEVAMGLTEGKNVARATGTKPKRSAPKTPRPRAGREATRPRKVTK